METNELLDGGMGVAHARLSSIDKVFLNSASKWAKFIAIVYFVMAGLLALGAFALIFGMGFLGGKSGMGGIGVGVGLFYLALDLLIIFPALYLYRYAKNTQIAIHSNDETALTESFRNLKSWFQFVGILFIIFIAFNLVFFVFGGLSLLTLALRGGE